MLSGNGLAVIIGPTVPASSEEFVLLFLNSAF